MVDPAVQGGESSEKNGDNINYNVHENETVLSSCVSVMSEEITPASH